MLNAQQLHYSYDGTHILRFPDIACAAGEHWLLLGQSGCGKTTLQSGCGKTTLLHLLGGLLAPRSGSVQVAGTDFDSLSTAQLDAFRGKNIGIIFQKSHFARALSVEENLLLAQQLAGLQPDRQRAAELLQHLDIGHKMKSRTDRLSQGEQQRVAIARAVINRPKLILNRPKLILADEPTSALDDDNCAEVVALLEREAAQTGATLVIDGRLKEKFTHRISLQPQRP